MKLFFACNICQGKIYLNSPAKTRLELAQSLGSDFRINCPHCRNANSPHINSITAEPSSSKSYLTGGGIGGAIGIIGGPFGIFLGALAGAAIGAAVDGTAENKNEQDAVRKFNNNY